MEEHHFPNYVHSICGRGWVNNGREEQAPTLVVAGQVTKKISPQHPIRRFWRENTWPHLPTDWPDLSLVVGGYLFYIARDDQCSRSANALKATTIIYDKDGNQAGSLTGAKGTLRWVRLCGKLLNAVATEDRSDKNSGINYGRFFLAIFGLPVAQVDRQSPKQLAKNAYLSQTDGGAEGWRSFSSSRDTKV